MNRNSFEVITEKDIYLNFDYVESIIGDTAFYQNYVDLFDVEDKTDVYFLSNNRRVDSHQINTFNDFVEKFDIRTIEEIFQSNFTLNEIRLFKNGKFSKTFIEVIQIPFNQPNYDLVLVCSKECKRFLVGKKQVSIRIEYLDGDIISALRKTNTTEAN